MNAETPIPFICVNLRSSAVKDLLCVLCVLPPPPSYGATGLRLFRLGLSFALFVPFGGYSRFLLELLLLLIFAHLGEPIVG
jgi:hypothetical protein